MPRSEDSEDASVELAPLLGGGAARLPRQRLEWPLALPVAACVVVFWVVAPSISLYNKWTFSLFGFKYPITYIMGTFSVNWVFAALLRWALVNHGRWYCCSVTDAASHRRRREAERAAARPPPRRMLVLGTCTAFEIATSNLSLLTLTVSFHTMVKSSMPLFVALFAVLMGLEPPSMQLLGVILVVTVGVVLCSYGEVVFDLVGFLYVLGSAMSGGLRWSLSQLLVQQQIDSAPLPTAADTFETHTGGKAGRSSEMQARATTQEAGEQNCGSKADWAAMRRRLRLTLIRATEMLYHQLPISVLSLIPFWLLLEQTAVLEYFARHQATGRGQTAAVELLLVVTGCATLAFVLICTELILLALTSSVTLAVLGIAKELMLIGASVLIFGDTLTGLNMLGFAIAMVGVVWFKYLRFTAHLARQGEPHKHTIRQRMSSPQRP